MLCIALHSFHSIPFQFIHTGYSHWQLYRDASTPNFPTTPLGKELFGRLERGVKRLDAAACTTLVEKLSLLCSQQRRGGGSSDGTSAGDVEAALQDLLDKLNGGGSTIETPLAAEQHKEDDDEENEGKADSGGGGASAAAALLATKGKKHEKYHSKQSRKEALLSKARSQAAVTTTTSTKTSCKTGKSTTQADASTSQPLPGAVLAAWLCPWLSRSLRQPPTTLPAARFFTCSDVSAVSCLSAATREAIHSNLTRPELHIGAQASMKTDDEAGPSNAAAAAVLGGGLGATLNMNADVEDACLAYQLFDQDPACGNVAEWFTAFKSIHSTAGDGDGGGEGEEDDEDEEEDGKQQGKKRRGRKTNSSKGRKTKKEKKKGSGSGSVKDEVKQRELTGRFGQAAAELQFMGLIKPGKRRARENTVQRAMHMPAPLMGDV